MRGGVIEMGYKEIENKYMWNPNSNISLTASNRRGLSTPIRKLVWLEETAQGLGILAALSGD